MYDKKQGIKKYAVEYVKNKVASDQYLYLTIFETVFIFLLHVRIFIKNINYNSLFC